MATLDLPAGGIPACILLIYGIPGSGKTLLTRHLVETTQTTALGLDATWNFVALHFDDFLPQDLRLQTEEKEYSQKEEEVFALKDARRKINVCIEQMIHVNRHGSQLEGAVSTNIDSSQWNSFVHTVNMSSVDGRQVIDDSGRLCSRKPTVLLLDDNMHLRSMRYEYYQLARQYQLGYAEVCVVCPASLAVRRNSQRQIPIPYTTIEGMERRLELPDPTKNHWEGRSLVLQNDGDKEDFLKTAWDGIVPLLQDAMASPVAPLPQEDSALKESCRLANLESRVHQADSILRKCVSAVMRSHSEHGTGQQKTAQMLAKQANGVRRELLEEIRAGTLWGKTPMTDEFRDELESTFLSRLQSTCSKTHTE